MASTAASEKRKKIILGVLMLGLAGVVVYQLFLKGPAPRSRTSAQNSNRATPEAQPRTVVQASAPAPQRSIRDEQEALLQQQLADTSPLNLAILKGGSGNATVGPRGNIFDYFKPPPPPPRKPDPPPPISLQMVQPQSAVAGTPRPLTMNVRGSGYPEDAVIIFDGRPFETTRVNASTLTTEIPPQAYSSPRSMVVEVKSKSDPATIFSNTATFVVQAAPEPPFKYIGRIGKLGIFELTGTREVTRLGQGDTIQGVWRIEAITDAAVEVIHTQYEIKKRLNMAEKRDD